MQTTIEALDASAHIVATTRSAADGRYALNVAPGRYTLVANTGIAFPRCPSLTVDVPNGAAVRADFNCDTGLRFPV